LLAAAVVVEQVALVTAEAVAVREVSFIPLALR
jgi:hypothetical protein